MPVRKIGRPTRKIGRPVAPRGVDDGFNNPGDWKREINRLETEISKQWRTFGDQQFGVRGPNGVRMPNTANIPAAKESIRSMNANAKMIGEITRYLKSLKR